MRKERKFTCAEPVVAYEGALRCRSNIGVVPDLGNCPIGSQMLYLEYGKNAVV